MEDTCHVLKRKKRKTRRCLNEIRKKSRSNSDIKNTENKINNVPKMIGQTCHNNFITANRLTLALYPKAVRSETITRPLLAEIRHEPGNINLNNIVKNKYTLKPETTAKENTVEAHTNNIHNTSVNMFSDDDSGNSEKENCINSVIFEMDRISDVTNCDNDNASAEGPSPPRASAENPGGFSPAPQLQEDYAYKKYVQFIREIPTYVQMHTPSILAEDPMRKPKALLQNMYLEERRRLIKKEQTSPTMNMHEPILENPMDYLKRCSTVSSLVSPATPALLSQGSQSSLTETPSPPPPPSPRGPPSVIQDTPEYTFFPHKLNQ